MFRIILLTIYLSLNIDLSLEYLREVQIINSCPLSTSKSNSSRSIRNVKQNYLSKLSKSNKDRSDSHESSHESDEDQSTDLESTELTLTIPSGLVNGTINNESLFITDANQDELNLTHARLCVNGSSFYITYSTNQPLPHTICLYLLLTNSQLYICQTLDSTNSVSDDDEQEDQDAKPSALFIIALSVVIGLLMLLICTIHTSREKRIVHRVRRHLLRTNDSNLSPMQEEILSATNLTATSTDRIFAKTDSITLHELTKKLTH